MRRPAAGPRFARDRAVEKQRRHRDGGLVGLRLPCVYTRNRGKALCIMEKEKNLHAGHRTRLKNRFLKEGIDGFEKHNMLELLLFYALPRQDTNPIAHALLNRFGSLSGVFAADIAELCAVEGVSEHTATLIKLVPEIARYAASEPDRGEVYTSLNKVGDLMVKRYAGVHVEIAYLLLFDNRAHLLDIVKVSTGTANRVEIDLRRVIECALKRNATSAVLTHNHPNGTLTPSAEDIATTEEVEKALKTIHVPLREHLLVAGNKYEPILSVSRGIFWEPPIEMNYHPEE